MPAASKGGFEPPVSLLADFHARNVGTPPRLRAFRSSGARYFGDCRSTNIVLLRSKDRAVHWTETRIDLKIWGTVASTVSEIYHCVLDVK